MEQTNKPKIGRPFGPPRTQYVAMLRTEIYEAFFAHCHANKIYGNVLLDEIISAYLATQAKVASVEAGPSRDKSK